MIAGTPLPRRIRRGRRRASEIAAPETSGHGRSERISLIEFLWLSPAGLQPVLLVRRELLH